MFKQNVMILISALAAIIVGTFAQDYSEFLNEYVKPFGMIFLNLLLWMVVPFIFVSIILGVSSLKDIKTVQSIGLKSIAYFFATTVIAVFIAIGLASACKGFFSPLQGNYPMDAVNHTASFTFMDAIVNLFPSNFIALFYKGNMIQIIVAAIFIGIGIIKVGKQCERIVKACREFNLLFSAILKMILKASPIAVFFLLCPIIAENGAAILGSLGIVILVAYIGYVVHALVIYSASLWIFSDVSPWKFYKYMIPAMVFAFSSTSSVGTIPINMQCTKKLGVDNKISSFVLTMGATVNMDGTAIFQSVATVFLACCYGIDLSYPQLFILMFTIIITSIGTAGIPSGGVLMLSVILTSVGLPIEGVAIIIGIDRIFDMGRSTVNILGDAACAVIINSQENKKNIKEDEEIDPKKPEYMLTPDDVLKKQKANKLTPEDIIRKQKLVFTPKID